MKSAAFAGGATAVLGTVGGVLPALVHSAITTGASESFSGALSSNLGVVAAIGAGQGLAAAAGALARRRGGAAVPGSRVLFAAFGVGTFNGLMYFVQMAVPATELGWALDLALLGSVGALGGWLAVPAPPRPVSTRAVH